MGNVYVTARLELEAWWKMIWMGRGWPLADGAQSSQSGEREQLSFP